MDHQLLSPRRPYLLRAYYDWLLDNALTPYLVVDATHPAARVPVEHVRDGRIVLNIAPRAVANLNFGKDMVFLETCFSGISHQITAPIAAVLAVYAGENGVGTLFEEEAAYRCSVAVTDRLGSKTVSDDACRGNDDNLGGTGPRSPSKRPLLHLVE